MKLFQGRPVREGRHSPPATTSRFYNVVFGGHLVSVGAAKGHNAVGLLVPPFARAAGEVIAGGRIGEAVLGQHGAGFLAGVELVHRFELAGVFALNGGSHGCGCGGWGWGWGWGLLFDEVTVGAGHFLGGVPCEGVQHGAGVFLRPATIEGGRDAGHVGLGLTEAAEALDHLNRVAAEVVGLLLRHLGDAGAVALGKADRVGIVNEAVEAAVDAVAGDVGGVVGECLPSAHLAHDGADEGGGNIGRGDEGFN